MATSGFNRTEKIRGIKERCVKENNQRCGITTERVLSRQWAGGRSARLSDKYPKKAMPIIKDKFSRSKEECANTIVAWNHSRTIEYKYKIEWQNERRYRARSGTIAEWWPSSDSETAPGTALPDRRRTIIHYITDISHKRWSWFWSDKVEMELWQ